MSRITKNDLMALLRVLPEYKGMTDEQLVQALGARAMEYVSAGMDELLREIASTAPAHRQIELCPVYNDGPALAAGPFLFCGVFRIERGRGLTRHARPVSVP